MRTDRRVPDHGHDRAVAPSGAALAPSLVDRLSRRAWSRAGAVAAVVSSGPTRRVLAASTRVGLLVAGTAAIGASAAVTLWTGLGAGPLDLFIGAIGARTGLPLALAVWAVVGSLTLAAWALGRRPGFGTVLSPLLCGPILQATLEALRGLGEPPSSLALRTAVHVVAIGGIGVGAGALVASGLGAGTGELFAGATSARVGRREIHVRPVIEVTWVVLGVALGGPAGVGTLLVAALIGPSVVNGHRCVDRAIARSRAGVAATHEAIVARELAADRRGERARRLATAG